MFNDFQEKDPDRCTLWFSESPPASVAGIFRIKWWLFPSVMAAVVFVLILVLGVTNTKTSTRLWSAEEEVSILYDKIESLNASLQQAHESIKEIHQLKFRIQDNKDQISSVSAALQELPQLDSLRKKVEALECSFKHIIQNASTSGPCCPLDWTLFGSDCYFFSKQLLPWNQSKTWCETKNAHLAILNSDKEWDFVFRHTGGTFYWVGLTDEKSGRWEWVNQTPYVMNRR
ncbi:PREDICTED: C-type lectin domain family 10 member A-like isoform X2 [Cyprinodon variegatus]|uniref:C-type lectin domain family 10 member A-like isoform X2 n=1 Tax=Cyprinodon variegatus TaxID=28743 RepID=UPI0007425451|nr:PREDICTED: C-type lectin domain family 10 member A-like isoform X2 [Cyprinodon variegatus]